MKIYIDTLGCPKNFNDSELAAGLLEHAGHEIVASPLDAEFIMVNTCSFINDAKTESIGRIFELAEYKEETGADIKIKRLLWTEEHFWNYKGRRHHGLAYYYLIDFCDGNDIPETEEFISQKDDCNVVLGWMPIDRLKDITIYPTFLKDEIYNLNGELKHFISKE